MQSDEPAPPVSPPSLAARWDCRIRRPRVIIGTTGAHPRNRASANREPAHCQASPRACSDQRGWRAATLCEREGSRFPCPMLFVPIPRRPRSPPACRRWRRRRSCNGEREVWLAPHSCVHNRPPLRANSGIQLPRSRTVARLGGGSTLSVGPGPCCSDRDRLWCESRDRLLSAPTTGQTKHNPATIRQTRL